MQLLKEAIFNEEELGLIESMFKTLVENRERIKREYAAHMDSTLPPGTQEMIDQLKNPAIKKMMEEIIGGTKERQMKEVDRRAEISIGILTKLSLYKNCMIQE